MQIFTPITTGNQDLDRVQKAIEVVLNGVAKKPLASTEIVEDVVLSTVSRDVPHKLGRKPLGYLVIKRDAAETVYDSEAGFPALDLRLTATGTVTVSLLIF